MTNASTILFLVVDDLGTADLGYTGLVWGAAKNKQDGCPADIYAPRWDPSVAPKASTRRFGLF